DGCPSNIAIPDVIKALNALRIYGEHTRPHSFYEKLIQSSGRARDCIECKQCENVCPQHLPITEYLKEAAEKLDIEEGLNLYESLCFLLVKAKQRDFSMSLSQLLFADTGFGCSLM